SGVRDLLRHVALAGPLQLLDDRAHRQQHVRPGVAVGDREDIEVVDRPLLRLQRGQRPAGELEHLFARHRASLKRAQTAFCTLPPLRQRVQTYARTGAPFTSTRTRWRFGLKRRFVATIECERLWPNDGF